MAVEVLPTPAVLEGLVKPKRVRKAILKAENSENGLKTSKNASLSSTNLENALNNLINLQNTLNMANNQNTTPNIATVALKTPEKVEMTTKISKKRSTTGDNSSIVEQKAPITATIGQILESTAPTNGKNVTIEQTNPVVDENMLILEEAEKTKDDVGETKRGRGRPKGSLNKVPRRKIGELVKPPVQHGKLGRPLGSKDKVPRKKIIREVVDKVESVAPKTGRGHPKDPRYNQIWGLVRPPGKFVRPLGS